MLQQRPKLASGRSSRPGRRRAAAELLGRRVAFFTASFVDSTGGEAQQTRGTVLMLLKKLPGGSWRSAPGPTICGCIARKAAVAAEMVCPGFSRSITVSNNARWLSTEERPPRMSASEGDDAYGVRIAEEIEQTGGRSVVMGAIYAALERLERNGLVSSLVGDPTPERGGRATRFFQVTPRGLRAVKQAQDALVALWTDLPQLKERRT